MIKLKQYIIGFSMAFNIEYSAMSEEDAVMQAKQFDIHFPPIELEVVECEIVNIQEA